MQSGTEPRVAWFTPLPPVRSGIARYSAELLAALDLACDVFVEGAPGNVFQPSDRTVVRNAHDFVWLHARHPYDLVVYQLGNAPCHDYMWGYLARYPGLVVLHDGQVHHARGRLLREQSRYDDYEREFAFNHPDVHSGVIDLGINGRLGSLTFLWPMRRVVVESARVLAVHSHWLAEQIAAQHPAARTAVVEMGVPASTPRPGAGSAVRNRHGIPADAVLFVALGEVTREKRIPQAIRALAAISGAVPGARLLLAGTVPDYYDPAAEARALGVEDRVTIAGYVADEDIDAYLDAADVCLCLRWPTSRETSAAWLRCLAAGRPTIVTDLVHTADVPAYDPRDWSVLRTPAFKTDSMGWPVPNRPVCVSIDILDEDHSLQLAMHRIATDVRLRERLGQCARDLWATRFTIEQMADGYRTLMNTALGAPSPRSDGIASLPRHFAADGTGHTAALLTRLGFDPEKIASLWRGAPGRS